jgi:glycosyltransferase involved in cell wall biosynthesis
MKELKKKVLIITYYWPPSGGAGVQRWLKFSKYLPEFGWEPVILTVDPEYAAYPVTDLSLIEDLPSSIKVFTTPAINYFSVYRNNKSKIPTAGFANNIDNSVRGKIFRFVRGNFFLPDPRRGWNIPAYKKAIELIDSEGITHIITTSPPHSTQLIGLKLKKKFPALKWLADLRDPWTDIYYYRQFYPTILSKAIDEGYEKNVLRKADKIITVGESLKTLFSEKIKGIAEKTFVVTNGYDESDFNGNPSLPPPILTITYTGTLSDIYPVEGLVKALKKLSETGKDFTMRFVGTISEKAKVMLLTEIPSSSLEFLPYVAHNEAIKYMMSSSFLVLIIPLHSSNKSIITGKLFEYIASGTPIVYLGPVDGDAAGIIRSASAGRIFNYLESDAMFNYLTKGSDGESQSHGDEKLKYSRKNLTGLISGILNS